MTLRNATSGRAAAIRYIKLSFSFTNHKITSSVLPLLMASVYLTEEYTLEFKEIRLSAIKDEPESLKIIGIHAHEPFRGPAGIMLV